MNELEVVVRPISSDDWPQLRRIRLEALEDTPEAFGATYAETVLFANDRWRLMAAQQHYFIAESDGKPVGMSRGGVNDEHPGTRWLYGMYVAPAYRGTDVSHRLVDAVVAWAKSEGANELYLHVTNKVPRAQAFYTKIGFAPTGDRFQMPRDSDVELITMKRVFDD